MDSNKRKREFARNIEAGVIEPIEVREVIDEQKKDISEVSTSFDAIVANCERLNIRDDINGNVITVLDANTELKASESPDSDWLQVTLSNGTEGFAMAKFIKKV